MSDNSNIAISQNTIEEQYTITNGMYDDLPRSNMPLAKDDIDEMQDLTADLVSARDNFYMYMEAGDLSNASKVVSDNPKLMPCLFNADKYNKLRDPIVALERTFLDDIENYIMNLSTPQGEWNENTSYTKYQVVSYNYEDAMQFYAARQMTVPSNSSVSNITNPTNPYYWTPVTLRGMRGTPGTGLTPAGHWNPSTNYYNYIDEDNNIHTSMVSYNNVLWEAVANTINSEPTYNMVNGVAISTNANWTAIMSLYQAADTILMPYGDTISNVIDKFDNRSKFNLEDLVINGYTYTAKKTSNSPLVWTENAYNTNNSVYATKISTKVSNIEWNIRYICNESNADYKIKYTKDSNGVWKGERI